MNPSGLQKSQPTILLVEDDTNDEALALRILAKYHIWNEVVVARDGSDAWNYIAGTGPYEGRSASDDLQLVLINWNIAAIGATELIHRMRATPSARHIPAVIMIQTKDEEDLIRGHNLDLTYPIAKPLGFFKLLEALQKLGVYWIVLSRPPS